MTTARTFFRGAFAPTRFDWIVYASMAVIVGLIGLTILLGDRVGVTIDRVSPLGVARSTARITLHFSEAMDRASVRERFRIEPEIDGEAAWTGHTFVFRPAQALQTGAEYTVILERGARSETGREVLSEHRFSFTVRRPRVAYLYPATEFPQNIWIADPADPTSAQQLTFSPSGVYDFAVSPDGSQIAFAENSTNGTTDIKLIDLETGGLVQLTNCVDASCTTPVWRPDGNTIAYERVDFNSDLQAQGVGSSPTRVWLIDLTTTPATTRPLFDSLQILGYNPQWSADGTRIAVYDNASASILVYDFTQNNLIGLPSQAGSSGALSPDGRKLVYPEIVITEGAGTRSYLRVAELDTGGLITLGQDGEPLDDRRAVWRPDGEVLAVARRDDRVTRGFQIYLLDPETGEVIRQLTDDPRYANQLFWWDPTGTQIVIQRFPELDENMQPNNLGLPEIWTLDVETGEMVKVAENGFLPRWVP